MGRVILDSSTLIEDCAKQGFDATKSVQTLIGHGSEASSFIYLGRVWSMTAATAARFCSTPRTSPSRSSGRNPEERGIQTRSWLEYSICYRGSIAAFP